MIPRSTGTDSTNSCSDQQTGNLHSFIPGLLCNAQKMCFRSYLHTNTCIHIQFLAYFLVLLPYLATSVALSCLVFPRCALESLQCQGLNPGFLQPKSQIRPQHHPPTQHCISLTQMLLAQQFCSPCFLLAITDMPLTLEMSTGLLVFSTPH